MSWKKITVHAEGNTDEALIEALEGMLHSVRAGSVKELFKKTDVGKYRYYLFKIEEVTVEKYGVDEGSNQEELEKKAAEGCPICGKQCVRHGKVLICPDHGSEPFETQKK